MVMTGAMAAGKSTVAEAAGRPAAARSVHVGGDVFRRMVVNGQADMSAERRRALAQLRLRYDLAIRTAEAYAAAGFDAWSRT